MIGKIGQRSIGSGAGRPAPEGTRYPGAKIRQPLG